MRKLNLALIGTLMVAPFFAGADEMKAVSIKSQMVFTFDITKDKKLSKPGMTVYNTKTGKTVSNYEETGIKYADSNVVIEVSGLDKVEIKTEPKARVGFTAEGTGVILNGDGSASASGIVDLGEPHTDLKWKARAGGFLVKGEGFQTVIDLMLNSERGQRDSLLKAMFPNANDSQLKIESRAMKVSGDLECSKSAKKKNYLTCVVHLENTESGQVLLTAEALENFNKSVAIMKKHASEGF
jgi:hypothetical protein